MKSFSIAFFIFIITHIKSSNGQLQLGIKGGFNLNHFNLGSKNFSIKHYKSGYHAGVFAKLKLFNWLAVQPELLYNTKGHSSDFFDYHLDYIDLPLFLVLNFSKNLNVHFGPYTSILTNGQVISDIQGLGERFDKNSFKDFDYGFSAGTAIGIRRLRVGMRYNWGKVTIIDDYRLAGKLHNIGDAKNSVWQLFLAISIVKI